MPPWKIYIEINNYNFPEVDPALAGTESNAVVYEPLSDGEDEMDDLVQEVWGLEIKSEDESSASGLSEDEGEEFSPSSSPVPDESKSKASFNTCKYLPP